MQSSHFLLGACVLADGLGALGHGVLGQKQAHGGLDLPGGDGGVFVVMSQTGRITPQKFH